MSEDSEDTEDSGSSSEEEFQEDYNARVRAFCEKVVCAMAKAAPPLLRGAFRSLVAENEGIVLPRTFTFQLGTGEDVTLLGNDRKRLHLRMPEEGFTAEERLYAYFDDHNFPEVLHAWHCGMGDGGRIMQQLVEDMCVEMDVVVEGNKIVDIQTPVVTFTSEHAFARMCMYDEEREEREERREERKRLTKRLTKKIKRKLERKRERECEREEEERAAHRRRVEEKAASEDLSHHCVGYFRVSCNSTDTRCYVSKFGEDHVIVTEEWFGANMDKVHDEAEWRYNAIGSLTRVVYASKEGEEIGGHFVPCEGCDLVETDSEEAAEAWGAKVAAE